MSRKKSPKRKLPGHYCWACGRRRPNERFSGRGHSRHLCRDCAKLGAEELACRQALRDLDRCMTWEGFIPRKRRKSFEQFLNHDDPRIRAAAERMQQADRATRSLMRADSEAYDLLAENHASADAGEEAWTEPDTNAWDTEIPY